MTAVRRSIRNPYPLRRRWLEAAVVAAAIVAFGLVGGAVGVGAGVLTAAVWYTLDVPYAIAVATISLVALVPTFEPAVVVVAVLMAALVTATTVTSNGSVRVIAASAIASFTLGGAAWVGIARGPTWLVTASLLGAVGAVGFVLHRLVLLELERGELDGERSRTGVDHTDATREP